jgi:hypothetical protein
MGSYLVINFFEWLDLESNNIQNILDYVEFLIHW